MAVCVRAVLGWSSGRPRERDDFSTVA